MSGPRQRTLTRKVTLDGVGLHSGKAASLTFLPADTGTGIRFRRTDGGGGEEVPASLESVSGTELGTSLGSGASRILTVEHALAALAALRIDNVRVEVDGPEVPIRDGSFQDWVEALDDAGVVEQDAEAKVITVRQPVSVTGEGGESYVAVPSDCLRVSATIDFGHPSIGRQFGSFAVDEGGFRTELAPARTFGFKADAEDLRVRGLALGASLENTVVLDESGVMNEGLRFPDEFLRHKVGDLVGDLALLGGRVEAHVVADRPSHAGNVALARALRDQHRLGAREPVLDIARIMRFLPHRYPMLLVDRIVHMEEGRRIVGIKNVTINEPFFQGHFPGHPIMPGVLIVEAMAQAGGLLLMEQISDADDKVVYFMTIDKVKFRRPVTPGDTLVFDVEAIQQRRGICKMRGRALVEGEVATEAEFMASIVDR
jgi:UDP-3-O-[3-hydroxymyristoyl] N-acetylglucosamine deacetylase / 3-hydroxyacyl-[acyl-carrier-protein] dehydratase